ncbi:uncharacterized protein K02A2.6-like [Corticium candelabrum]|uniref:uncharacterized protein K02A2.6-like n=1 Tax=Corticium candelabrum TaxID=121492 RepID=UPI002E2766EE|nr:uncharacterized protein K02A2.6-like [Corticium candelabrum]
MKALDRSFVWWVNLDKDVEELVKTCEQCQNARHRPSTTNPPHSWLYPNRSWERVHCDLAEFVHRHSTPAHTAVPSSLKWAGGTTRSRVKEEPQRTLFSHFKLNQSMQN